MLYFIFGYVIRASQLFALVYSDLYCTVCSVHGLPSVCYVHAVVTLQHFVFRVVSVEFTPNTVPEWLSKASHFL